MLILLLHYCWIEGSSDDPAVVIKTNRIPAQAENKGLKL